MSDPIRVFLLDDHEIVRRGVAELLDAEDPTSIVSASTGSAVGAVSAIAACSQPDVAVLDVRLGDGTGIEVCRDIRAAHPEIACLMLTSFSDDEALLDAAVAGAAGYVLKQIRTTDLIESIRKVAGGAPAARPGRGPHAHCARLSETEDGAIRS